MFNAPKRKISTTTFSRRHPRLNHELFLIPRASTTEESQFRQWNEGTGPWNAVMTMADGVSRTTYMPKSIERENQGMIAWNEWLEGGRGCSRALPVGPDATIHTYICTYSQPQFDPWKAYSLALATFSPRFHYPPPSAAAYRRKRHHALVVFFFLQQAYACHVSFRIQLIRYFGFVELICNYITLHIILHTRVNVKLIYVYDEE